MTSQNLKKSEILICGDFNSRIGGLNDSIDHDTITDTFQECPLPEIYEAGVAEHKSQLDTKSNLHGHLLIDICKTFRLSLLNGRFRGDSLGYFTFFKSNGTITVDYMLVSGQLVHNIRLNVLPPNELSDHSLINTSIETN